MKLGWVILGACLGWFGGTLDATAAPDRIGVLEVQTTGMDNSPRGLLTILESLRILGLLHLS